MIKKIDGENLIFKTDEFIRDKYKFYIALKILSDKSSIIYSNEKDYVIMQSDSNRPIWIWTKNDIESTMINEIVEAINLYYKHDSKITCKKEFYDLLLKYNNDLIDADKYFEMGTLYCSKTTQPKTCDGYMEIATIKDLDVIADYWYRDNLETEDMSMNIERAKADAKEMIESGTTYILKNKDNKIVCMASYNQILDVAKINHVYTPTEERRKGYCANLIYELSNMLLSKGITPMLYTDYNYIPSNRSYMNAGYVKDGVLVSFYLKEDEK